MIVNFKRTIKTILQWVKSKIINQAEIHSSLTLPRGNTDYPATDTAEWDFFNVRNCFGFKQKIQTGNCSEAR
jgi:hypothetical protein